ncbi:MAG: fumarylacetoacetase [Dehalococcoidia bacterium]|jgi:2-keto-4-pentenoate hydratase/2-oxohepta-3-ene-1,7-dioic acid hydratase in catechol pathway|nr:fumarylacetoacetate hydrolase family protein [Dehalococcoidia bacterium]PCJ75265.1 MAG: fumarylacetoacetase [Dehalococcoidia bacterium]RUA30215.1 MAG: fumarylacetoacetate hydrolase family protein [Chloroflexota bacterium]HIM62657.1 fumarylacetoacetate hydrolase family protein [Dehalococcoidia bacterium]HIN25487.1 fumarylacetoacetate hydrolase family protein [Dehalococcoidia bacterium]|tara:strand:+ start:4091 stop:5104 length:1014 start_codon:yes stop_codon:yes gene_type:complete
MKLLTYETDKGPRCGVLQDGQVVDVSDLLGAGGHPLRDVRALLEQGDSPLDRVRDALAKDDSVQKLPLADVRLLAPVIQPPTVRDFIVYEEHASNQGTREPNEVWYRMPVFYFSNPLCIYGTDAQIPYPSASSQFDYELEIGIVIGREGRDVPADAALDHIAGFMIFNDWSARDLQVDEMAFGLGPAKGKDTASSIGPWLVTTDELLPYLKDGRLKLKCEVRVNGDHWLKDGAAADAYFTFGDMVERASKDSRIVPGDVIGSGTVGGGSIREAIRKGYEKARFLEPGDVVEHEVEAIGVLRGTIGPKPKLDPNYRFQVKNPAPVPEAGISKDYKYQR